MKTAALTTITLVCTLLASSSLASADLRDVGRFIYGSTLKAIGGAGAFAVHEGCHFATVSAFGGESRFVDGVVTTRGLSQRGHRAVSWSGNVCTAVLAEVIMWNGWHRKSHLAWGALAFHSGNVLGYSVSPLNRGPNDKRYFVNQGGSPTTWFALHYTHGARSALVLHEDLDLGFLLNRGGQWF